MRYIICFLLISILSFSGFSAPKNPAPKNTQPVSSVPPYSAESASVTEQENAEAHFDTGHSLFYKGSYKEALAEFIKALSYKPDMLKARCWMAKTYYKMGHYRSAVNQCNAALKIEPGDAFSRRLMSLAQKKLTAKRAAPRPTLISNETVAENSPQTAVLPSSAEAINEAGANTIEASSSQKMPVLIVKKKQPQHLISLDLRNVDISSVLQVFSKETGINVVAGHDVYGKVSVILNNVTPDDALDIILKSNGYTYTREGDMVQVFSSTEPARVEELPDGSFVRTFMIDYVDPEELLSTLTKLMPENTNVYSTKGSKTIIIKGSANDIKRAEVLIRNLDIPPREVMVEAKVISVSLSEGQSLGMNHLWTNPNNTNEKLKSTGNVVNSPDWFNPTETPSATNSPSGLYYEITNQDIQSIVEALSTRTGFQVLSSPKVMALNDQRAEIKTGSQLGYNVSTVTNGVVSNTVQFLDVGTKLDITPSIKSDGLIEMEIHPEISDGIIDKSTGLPSKTSTETTTQLIVKDGQVIIIGGLIRDSVQKEVHGIPVLMDVPIIGSLFKRTDLTADKSEIIVLISPHIVNQKYTAEMENKINEMNQQRQFSPAMTLDLFR